MKRKEWTLQITDLRTIVIAAWSMFAVIILLNVFLVYIVLPESGNLISVYVPARSGGNTYYFNASELNLLAAISTAMLALSAGFVSLFAKLGKHTAVFLSLIFIFFATTLYFPTMLGNGFDELFDVWWMSLIGTVLGIGIVITYLNIVIKRIKTT